MSFKLVVCYLPSVLKRSTTNPYLLGRILRHEKKGLLHHLFHTAESTAFIFHCPQKYESKDLSWCFTRGPFTIILKIRRNCALLEIATAEAAGPRAVTRGWRVEMVQWFKQSSSAFDIYALFETLNEVTTPLILAGYLVHIKTALSAIYNLLHTSSIWLRIKITSSL